MSDPTFDEEARRASTELQDAADQRTSARPSVAALQRRGRMARAGQATGVALAALAGLVFAFQLTGIGNDPKVQVIDQPDDAGPGPPTDEAPPELDDAGSGPPTDEAPPELDRSPASDEFRRQVEEALVARGIVDYELEGSEQIESLMEGLTVRPASGGAISITRQDHGELPPQSALDGHNVDYRTETEGETEIVSIVSPSRYNQVLIRTNQQLWNVTASELPGKDEPTPLTLEEVRALAFELHER